MLDNFTKQEISAIVGGLRLVQLYQDQKLSYLGPDWTEVTFIAQSISEHGELANDEVDLLVERINTNVMTCPYCQSLMEGTEQFYDDPTGDTKRWLCPECGAAELRTRHPGNAPV